MSTTQNQANSAADQAAATANNLAQTVVNGASNAATTIRDHPVTQNIANGPVATSVKQEAAQTSNEFGDLANSKTKPNYTAANDTTLTHYHSFFYTLLSWEKPRATGITFAASVLFIFACRYLPVIKWILKATYLVLGFVTLAEASTKFIMGSSVAGSVRPRRYYKIPKETLETSLDDLEQLINFFVIEVQRIIFAENIPVTAAAFSAALASYFLIKILPFWGMALLSTCVIYIVPLIYVQNKELIDSQLEHTSNVISSQASQLKDVTAQHTSKGFESVKAYTSDYTAKASELIGSARQQIPVPGQTSGKTVSASDLPDAPSTKLPSSVDHTKPIATAPTPEAPIAASVN